MRRLRENEVKFIIECRHEHIPIEGNCSAIDPETDATAEQWITDQLLAGNQWAWCHIVVRARWKDFEGVDSLGCCSYESEKDFCQPGGYYDDMKSEALADLNANIERAAEQLEELIPLAEECE